MSRYPEHLLYLIELLRKFPGIGSRSAERLAFDLLSWPREKQRMLAEAIAQIHDKVTTCRECGALIGEAHCPFCDVNMRETDLLCVVAFSKDLFLIDQTKQYRGLYHVLGGLISPIEQLSISDETIAHLKERIARHAIREVILALDSTLEGDATALYIKQALAQDSLPISRLAFGLPMGSSLDFIDGGTLTRALQGRLAF